MFEGIELFASMSKQDLDNLALFCQERSLKSGEILFHEWDESTSMYIVKSWLLQAYKGNKVLWEIHPSQPVGEMAIFNQPQHRSASVKALNDSELIVIIYYSLEELIKKHPNIVQKIQTFIDERNKQNLWKI